MIALRSRRQNADRSLFRKVAKAAWTDAADPSVYGLFEVDFSEAQSLMQQLNKSAAVRVTPMHIVTKALCRAVQRVPQINAFMAWQRIYQRPCVEFGFMTHIPNRNQAGTDLTVIKLSHLEDKSLTELAQELSEKIREVRQDPNIGLGFAAKLIQYLPQPMVNILISLYSFFTFNLNLNLSPLGFPKESFGSCIITNLSSFNVETGLIPLVPFTRAPMMVALGKVQKRPWVVGDQIEIRPILPVGVTFDHRFMDGVHAGMMIRELKKCLKNPKENLIESMEVL